MYMYILQYVHVFNLAFVACLLPCFSCDACVSCVKKITQRALRWIEARQRTVYVHLNFTYLFFNPKLIPVFMSLRYCLFCLYIFYTIAGALMSFKGLTARDATPSVVTF